MEERGEWEGDVGIGAPSAVIYEGPFAFGEIRRSKQRKRNDALAALEPA